MATFDQRNEDSEYHGIAFAGLISYIEEARMDSLVVSVFKLTDLANMYSNRLEQLGSGVAGCDHSSRLKERILAFFPDMGAHKQGREVVLVCNKMLDQQYERRVKRWLTTMLFILPRLLTLSGEMFKLKKQFSGSFDAKCQEESVPISLLVLVDMVLNGTNIKTHSKSLTRPR